MSATNISQQLSFKTLLIAARLKTLTAALIPVLVGSGLAYGLQEKLDVVMLICAALSALFIQVGTNFFNDALDFEKGADTEDRIGPQRITQSGMLSPKKVKMLALASFGIASLLAIPLLLKGGYVILAIGIVSLVCGYLYTGGPFPLAYTGLGDLFVIIFFGLVAVTGTFYLHTLSFEIEALMAGLQVGMLATTLIAVNNARDIEQDRKANKKTLAVRFGYKFMQFEIILTQVIPMIICWYWWDRGFHLAAFLPMVSMLWSFNLIMDILNSKPGPKFNEYLAQSAKIHIVFGLSLAFGFLY